MRDDNLEPPKRTGADAGHAVARAVLGALPVAGSAAVELFTSIVVPPLERRRDEWMRRVGEDLKDLHDKRGVDLDDLKKDERFLDTVLQASQAALRTSQQEKLDALRNAVVNAALPGAPERAVQQMFLLWVDSFTEWHLRLLRLFHDPVAWFRQAGAKPPDLYMGSLDALLKAAYPQLRDRNAFYTQVWRDLFQEGLVSTEGLVTMMTGPGTLSRRTTDLGAEFLAFVGSPTPPPGRGQR